MPRLARRHRNAGNALAGERVVRTLIPDPYLLQRRPVTERRGVATFGEISPQTDQPELCSAHPDDMNPDESATQALLAGLRAQSTLDGDHWLHALIDPDLHRTTEPDLVAPVTATAAPQATCGQDHMRRQSRHLLSVRSVDNPVSLVSETSDDGEVRRRDWTDDRAKLAEGTRR